MQVLAVVHCSAHPCSLIWLGHVVKAKEPPVPQRVTNIHGALKKTFIFGHEHAHSEEGEGILLVMLPQNCIMDCT